MLRIDKDVPIPGKKTGRREVKYPFAQMEVGDSFALTGEVEKTTNLLRNTALRYAKQLGYKFTVRSTEDGARVWRVE